MGLRLDWMLASRLHMLNHNSFSGIALQGAIQIEGHLPGRPPLLFQLFLQSQNLKPGPTNPVTSQVTHLHE